MNNNIKVEMIETNKIKPYIRNARINDITVQKLCEVIEKVGFNQPIVIDKENVIVKGHSRWKAAVKLGLDKVPCIVSQNDEETNKFDRLADNKVQEFSKWDNEILNTELASINLDDIDLSDFGFELNVDFTDYEIPSIETNYEAPIYNEEQIIPTKNIDFEKQFEQKEDFISEKDINKTVAHNETEYGRVTCPKCGQVVLYKKQK